MNGSVKVCRILISAACLLGVLISYGVACGRKWAVRSPGAERLERSYWLHASLGASIAKGYWQEDAAVGKLPSSAEIRRAAGLLTGHYAANRLYLLYHKEIPIPQFATLMRTWRAACPDDIELIPTLVLRTYYKHPQELFSEQELDRLCRLLTDDLKFRAAAVYDVLPNRDQGRGLAVLARWFPGCLIRLGLQPEEELDDSYTAAVQDTWSGLCHGKSNEDWQAPGFGADALRKWVNERDARARPISWDLVAVAWDYSAAARGEYPGYDDASKNMPLPAGRNRLAAREVLVTASRKVFRGFSSDLVTLETNSRNPKRDGRSGSIYQVLRRGEVYRGYFRVPLEEIASIYNDLQSGKLPSAQPRRCSSG